MATGDKSAEMLREEILNQARREAGEIIGRARREAEELMAAAASLCRRASEEQRDLAHVEGRRRKELVLATCSIEENRLRVARIESLLDSIREEVRRRLLAREGFDYKEAVTNLAAHGVSGMTGSSFVLKVSDLDRAFLGNGLPGEVALRVGRTPLEVRLSYEKAITDGGVMVEDEEARQSWDNRLPIRLERMWPDLRRQIALQTSLAMQAGSREAG